MYTKLAIFKYPVLRKILYNYFLLLLLFQFSKQKYVFKALKLKEAGAYLSNINRYRKRYSNFQIAVDTKHKSRI